MKRKQAAYPLEYLRGWTHGRKGLSATAQTLRMLVLGASDAEITSYILGHRDGSGDKMGGL